MRYSSMPHLRSYLHPSPVLPKERIQLSKSESHHLIRVNRGRQGSPVSVFDGQGNEWQCHIAKPDPQGTLLKIQEYTQILRPTCKLVLAQALPKGKTMDQIVRKATEMGVTHIVPLQTQQTQVHPKEKNQHKIEKWTSIAIEACKQSGNSYLPEIQPIQPLELWLSQQSGCDTKSLKLVASLESSAISLRENIKKFSSHNKGLPWKIICLVGPEGDFTPQEYSLLRSQVFQPIRLAMHVLRVETAAIYALSIIDYELFIHQHDQRLLNYF